MSDTSPTLDGHINPFSLDHSKLLTGSYVNKKAPRIRNVKSRMRTLPDLVFSKTEFGGVDLKNVLVSVDGNFAMPEYSEQSDELFVKNGAYLLRGTEGPDQNVVFIDFSDMIAEGTTLRKAYLHECSPDLFFNGSETISIYHNDLPAVDTLLSRNILFWKSTTATLRFSVKADNLKEGQCQVPLFCFAGRIFFPGMDEFTYYGFEKDKQNYIHIDFTIDLKLLSRIVASNLQHGGVFLGRGSLYHVVITYALSNIFTARNLNVSHSTEEWRAIEYMCKADIPFVTLLTLDRPAKFTKINPVMALNDGDMLFPADSHGLLIHSLTREVTDYNRIKYPSYTHVETTPPDPIYLSQTGQAALHLNRSSAYVAQKDGGEDIDAFFPAGTTFQYSAQDGNCIIARGPEGAIYARSSQNPFVMRDATHYYECSIDDIPTPYEEVMTMDQNKSIIYINGKAEYVSINAKQSQGARIYRKVVEHTSDTLRWTVYESLLEIPDSLRYQNLMWKADPVLFSDEYNRCSPGKNIKDPEKYFMLDIEYVKKEPDIPEPEFHDENEEPDIPVKTIEYQHLKNKLKTVIRN